MELEQQINREKQNKKTLHEKKKKINSVSLVLVADHEHYTDRYWGLDVFLKITKQTL